MQAWARHAFWARMLQQELARGGSTVAAALSFRER